MTNRTPAFDVAEFWSYVAKSDTCWLWRGWVSDGYGLHRVGPLRVPARAHRLAYQLANGPVPAGQVVDHLCRNRACVNPAHMEIVSNAENVRRGRAGARWAEIQTSRTHCVNGHEYTPENTYMRRGKWRTCRACAAARRLRSRTSR